MLFKQLTFGAVIRATSPHAVDEELAPVADGREHIVRRTHNQSEQHRKNNLHFHPHFILWLARAAESNVNKTRLARVSNKKVHSFDKCVNVK